MTLANVARVVAVLAACTAAIGSATSSTDQNASMMPQYGQAAHNTSPPPPQQMEPERALGLWRSNFGAVKIEPDLRAGGLPNGAVQGAWLYQRQGQEVVGLFWGHLRGNVLQFQWQEPSNPPLTGAGYLVFDTTGRQYQGRWWTEQRDRVGDWNGWRQPSQQQDYAQPYGGQTYGDPWGGQGSTQPYAPPPQPQPYPPPQPRYY